MIRAKVTIIKDGKKEEWEELCEFLHHHYRDTETRTMGLRSHSANGDLFKIESTELTEDDLNDMQSFIDLKRKEFKLKNTTLG